MGEQRQPAELREAATKVVSVLRDAGHVAYFAGGCVRDMLRGATAKDYDVATDAEPEVVAGLFRRTHAVGQAFGVMLVRLMGCEVEVATFRLEWGYEDGRRPDGVAYTDAEHDAQRRDFTINGLFYDPIEGRVIDYVGGQEDLRAEVIRAIGDADARFGEDYLRMLRAVRFAARLGFEIEAETAGAIQRHAARLGQISRERIGMEVEMMMTGAGRRRAVGLLGSLGLEAVVLNEEGARPRCGMTEALEDGLGYAAGLAAWVCDWHAGSREELERMKVVQVMNRWRDALVLSNEVRDGVVGVLKALPVLLDWEGLGVAKRKRMLAREDWAVLWGVLRAWGRVLGGVDEAGMGEAIARLHVEGVSPDALVTGDDLVAAGYAPGPSFKRVLDAVYDAQLEGRVCDREGAMGLAREEMENG